MFLKRLEIVGFKSFAERIQIDFVPGVTAVVGPNGSGKSNIIDAIRWVLGEQSAKSLRGSKMEDVIFAGSDSRKAVNFAEVTLILDNSKNLFPLAYTEISVSRRVFRSGESVYLLNGQQCRLKDITSIFMDSGLGKEAFSIISQGRVDEILNSRPEERRNVFDEAAGVLKYKLRKQKAEHKLFETADHLDRVLDILKELDDRLAPLEKDAAAARRHEGLSKQLRELDVRLLNFDAWHLRKQLIKETANMERFEQQQETVAALLNAKETEMEGAKKTLAQSEERMEALQQQLMNVTSQSEKWEGRRLLSLEKSRNTKQQIERISAEISAKESERSATEHKLNSMLQKQKGTAEELATIEREIADVTKLLKHSAEETEEQIETLKSIYIERLNEEATIRSDLRHLEERLQGEKSSSERIAKQTTLLNERKQGLAVERQELEKIAAAISAEAADIEAQFQQVADSLKQAEELLANQQQVMQQALNKQSEMQGRLRALESLEKEFSGFYSGVREILLAKKKQAIGGIDGAVAELISADSPYVLAIETALGGAMQHIITATEADARKAIGYLKMKNRGRATFLPRDIIKPREVPYQVRQLAAGHPEYIGTANELIQTTSLYENIAANLLGQTIVAKTLEGASSIAKKIGYRFRIVTLDGDVVNAGGSLTGGGVKGQSTVFSRKAELESLTEQLKNMDRSIHEAQKKMGSVKETIGRQLQQREQLRQTMEQLQQKKVESDSSLRELVVEIRSVEVELSTIEMGRAGTATMEADLLEQQKSLIGRQKELETELSSIRQQVDSLERLAENRREEEEQLEKRLASLQQRAAVLKEQRVHYRSSVEEWRQTIQELTNKLQQLNEELHYIQGHGPGKEMSTEEIEQNIERSLADKRKLEQRIDEERKQRTQSNEAVIVLEQQLRELRSQHAELLGELNNSKVRLSRIETKCETVVHRLDEEYGLAPDRKYENEQVDDTAMRSKVEQLKQQLAELGPVNPNAIREFEEVHERHAFLTEQRNDLIEAKTTLQEAMSEMDQEMKTRFQTTYEAVQSRFKRVFQEMFGGGEADLVLTKPDDLLETGVDIIARPPGKKLQNLSLLSGGERALTVISLLFSILEVRPVPFCILDEVEAALDEANVVRYSNYLKKVSETTQFIVITHRKGTMEGADVLYGVTMQESGVSKLISVKLSEVPQEVS